MLKYKILPNIEFIKDQSIKTLIKGVKETEPELLIASDLWFDDIVKNGKIMDTYIAMDWYYEAFNDISLRISGHIQNKPKELNCENNELKTQTKGLPGLNYIHFWENKDLALALSHEDKELSIMIWLINTK